MKWIEVFKGGQQTDSKGRKHDGDKVIERALSTFNAAEYSPPLVIGHPKTDSPAFGWIGGVRKTVKNGVNHLEAGLKQIYPEVAQMVKDGLFKKVSASFYEDGRLRHVGLLGAAAPAVKGLADVAFTEGAECFDFESPVKAEASSTFTEADLERARAEGRAEVERAHRRAGVSAKVDSLVNSGHLPPAFVEAGFKDFCEFLGGLDSVIEFSEKDREAVSPLDFFFDFVERFSKTSSLFSEFATIGRLGEIKPDPDVETGKDIAKRASR